MLQNSTASPLVGFTDIPFTILPPQLHSPSPAWSFRDKNVQNKRISSKNKFAHKALIVITITILDTFFVKCMQVDKS